MLWYRQAIFESKGDKMSSSAEWRIRTQGLWNWISNIRNGHCQTDWAIEDQAKTQLNSKSHPYDQRAFSPLDLTAGWRSHLALVIHIFVAVNSDALAQASEFWIESRQVVFLCWTNNKQNINVPYYWPFVRGMNWWLTSGFPSQRTSKAKPFQVHDVIMKTKHAKTFYLSYEIYHYETNKSSFCEILVIAWLPSRQPVAKISSICPHFHHTHDDVIKWKHFPRYWPFVRGIHRWPGNSPVNGEFPTQRPVTRSFDVFFDLHPNERLSKQSWGWWVETLSRSLWRHCNATDLERFLVDRGEDSEGDLHHAERHRRHTVGMRFGKLRHATDDHVGVAYRFHLES